RSRGGRERRRAAHARHLVRAESGHRLRQPGGAPQRGPRLMASVLREILEHKRLELPALRRRPLPPPPPPRPVQLARPPGAGLRLIAEIKRRSPSAGPLSTALGVSERAQAYERGGARMISVLCDEKHFDGAYQHLALARAATS